MTPYVTLWFGIHNYYAMHLFPNSVAGVKGEVHSRTRVQTADERITCSHAQTGPLINMGLENELSTAILAFVVVEMLRIRHATSACVEKAVQIVKVL